MSKHIICTADTNQEIYVPQTRAEIKEGKERELLVFGQCSQKGCTRRAKEEQMGPLTLMLCREDVYRLSTHSRGRERNLVEEMSREGLITKHTKGWTYVIRLANGNVKIGTTVNLNNRLQTLSRDQGGVPVVVLAVLPGGVSREALTHKEWESYRIAGAMEEFHPAPELLRWAADQGIDEGATEGAEKFQNWKPKNDGSKKWARLTELMNNNQEQ